MRPAALSRPQATPVVRVKRAAGFDGRDLHPGDRVAFQPKAGIWVPASILHLERSSGSEVAAWLLAGATGKQWVEIMPAAGCLLVARAPSRR